MTFARIAGGGICTMSPAAARQTRTAQSAADGRGRQKSPRESGGFAEGRSWRSEATDDHTKPSGGSRRYHVGGAAGAPIPVDEQSIRILRHLAVADRTRELPPPTPVGGEGAERQPTGAGIALGERIGASGAAGHDFDIRKTAHKKPIEIGSQPIKVRKRARTSDNKLKHSSAPPHFESAEPPQAEASADCLAVRREKRPLSRARSAKFTLDGGLFLWLVPPVPLAH